jgi:hypothetical protein
MMERTHDAAVELPTDVAGERGIISSHVKCALDRDIGSADGRVAPVSG